MLKSIQKTSAKIITFIRPPDSLLLTATVDLDANVTQKKKVFQGIFQFIITMLQYFQATPAPTCDSLCFISQQSKRGGE